MGSFSENPETRYSEHGDVQTVLIDLSTDRFEDVLVRSDAVPLPSEEHSLHKQPVTLQIYSP